jgi:hypothetical protein
MTRSEEYEFYAIAERSYKECVEKHATYWVGEKEKPQLKKDPASYPNCEAGAPCRGKRNPGLKTPRGF